MALAEHQDHPRPEPLRLALPINSGERAAVVTLMPALRVRSDGTSHRRGLALDVERFAWQTLLGPDISAHPNQPCLTGSQGA